MPRGFLREDLIPEIRSALVNDYAFKVSSDHKHLQFGKCPDCGKKELWGYYEKPLAIQCSRLNNCNFKATTKELYPDIFQEFSKRYPPKQDNPHATADAYLQHQRGFDLSVISNWYSQNKYYHPHGDRGSETVRFNLVADGSVFWERIIDTVHITDPDTGEKKPRKANFKKGKKGEDGHKGLWWQPPGMLLEEKDTIYWCEGIFDAIALYLNGYKAVALMTCGKFPDRSLAALNPSLKNSIKWVLALDNDKAGRQFNKKHVERLRGMDLRADCAMPANDSRKVDWNDHHLDGKLTAADMKRYHYYGALLVAENRDQKARLIFQQTKLSLYVFSFRQKMHAVTVDMSAYSKESHGLNEQDKNSREILEGAFSAASKITQIANFDMEFLYIQQPVTGENNQNFIRIDYPNGSDSQKLPFPGSVFSSASDFKKGIMNSGTGAQFTGTSKQLDLLYQSWFYKKPRIVRALDFIGYDTTSGAYVFNQFAVHQGSVVALNDEDFFDLHGKGIKSQAPIKLNLSTSQNVSWFEDFKIAYGQKGLVALVYWFATLFAEQIRGRHESFPYLEIYGEPGSGKSYLIQFLWKLFGRENHEGFDPNKSTAVGRSRYMTQVSNLPVVMIEADRDENTHGRKFDWEEIKTLYNGEIGRVTGVKNQGNDTKFPAFRGSLIIAQNAPVSASDAVLSRICQVHFDRSHHTPEGRVASDNLSQLATEDISSFVKMAAVKETEILREFNQTVKDYEGRILRSEKVKMVRIGKNHAQLMAMARCLRHVLPITEPEVTELQKSIFSLAENRQQAINSDHPTVQQFWALFDYLDSRSTTMQDGPTLEENLMNHSSKPDQEIAINLEHFEQKCRDNKLDVLPKRDLMQLLLTSKKRKFICNKAVHSRILKRTVRCWVFNQV
jgi:hypothetical protein